VSSSEIAATYGRPVLVRRDPQPVAVAVGHQVLADHQVREVAQAHRTRNEEGDDEGDDEAVAVAGRDEDRLRPLLAGLHECDAEGEQVAREPACGPPG
jgi:hypothetical protein